MRILYQKLKLENVNPIPKMWLQFCCWPFVVWRRLLPSIRESYVYISSVCDITTSVLLWFAKGSLCHIHVVIPWRRWGRADRESFSTRIAICLSVKPTISSVRDCPCRSNSKKNSNICPRTNRQWQHHHHHLLLPLLLQLASGHKNWAVLPTVYHKLLMIFKDEMRTNKSEWVKKNSRKFTAY